MDNIKEGIVYLLTNIHNGKRYIGQSSRGLKYFTERYWGSGKLIKRSIRKYGQESFTKQVLWYKVDCSKEELDTIETEYIAKFSPEYNIAEKAGGGNMGEKWRDRVQEGVTQLYADLEYAASASERARQRWNEVTSEERAKFAAKGWTNKTGEERVAISRKIQSKISKEKKVEALHQFHEGLSIEERESRKERLREGIVKSLNKNIQVRCIETGQTFDTIAEAARHFGIDRTGIVRALGNPKATSAGFHWQRLPISLECVTGPNTISN